jgi:hypothetical protein
MKGKNCEHGERGKVAVRDSPSMARFRFDAKWAVREIVSVNTCACIEQPRTTLQETKGADGQVAPAWRVRTHGALRGRRRRILPVRGLVKNWSAVVWRRIPLGGASAVDADLLPYLKPTRSWRPDDGCPTSAAGSKRSRSVGLPALT